MMPADQSARETAITEFSRPIFLEAAAGTGKTRVMTDRILHIVRTGKAEMTDIVAITFTEKAAGELTVKLRHELEKAFHEMHGEERRRVGIAIRQLELAQVNTIHAFCAWLLKQRPVEAGVDLSFDVADDLKTRLLRAEVWDEWFRAEASREPAPEILRRALYNSIDLQALHKLAGKLCANRDRLPHSPSEPDNCEPDERTRLDDLRAALREAKRIMAAMAPLARSNPRTKKPAAELERLKLVLSDAESLDAMALERLLLAQLHFEMGESKRENWKPPNHYDELLALSERLNGVRQQLVDALLRGLLTWLSGFLGAYEERKHREALLDFDDLLLKTRDVLKRNARVRQQFKERFKFILIDEFQDTDPAQVEIALFLAERLGAPSTVTDWRNIQLEPGKLFVVGDPKQSIYRFRRADIEIYEGAKRIVCGSDGALTISVNFRTLPKVAEWVNRAFVPLIRRPSDGAYQPDYVPLLAHRGADKADARRVWLIGPTAKEQQAIDDGADVTNLREMEAAALAQCLQTMHGQQCVFDPDAEKWRAAQWRDMAILFRALSDIQIYERALEEFGVPYQVEGGKDYFKRPEVRAVCSLLLCLDNPMNTRELVATLRSPLFGISDEEIFLWKNTGQALDYLAGEVNGETAMARALLALRRLHETRNQMSFASCLERIYGELRAPELFSLMSRGEQRVANLWKLVDFARAAQAAGMMTLRELARHIRDVALDITEEQQSPASEAADDVVHLITMHKAKGLEWPLVALADLGRQPKAQHDSFYVDRVTHRVEIACGKLTTAGFDGARAAERKREDAEELRLLYVAATRARDGLIIPWFETAREKSFFYKALRDDCSPAKLAENDPLVERMNHDSVKARRSTSHHVQVELDAPRGAARKTVESAIEERRAWLEKRQTWLAQIVQPRARRRPSAHEDESLAEVVSAGWLAKQIGTTVHEALEAADVKAATTEQLRAVRACVAASALPESARRRALALAETALGSELWRRICRGNVVRKEVPFCLDLDGQLVEGFIDVAFEENGRWFLSDYKTDEITEDDLPARVEFYRSQMETYARAFEEITKLKLAGKYLLFLTLNRLVEI
jgi:ATP-dependent exoDNAse (exonuclease V) beta subunit